MKVIVEDDDTAGFSVSPSSVAVGELSVSETLSVPMFVQLPDNHSFVDATRTCSSMGMVVADICCESPGTALVVASENCVAEAPGYCLLHGWDCSSMSLLAANGSQCSTPANAATNSAREMIAEELRSSSLWPLCITGMRISVPEAAIRANNGSALPSAQVFPSVICSVVLDTEPLGDVAVVLDAPGHGVYIEPNSTTFTRGDWSLPRFVVVGARDDFTAEPNDVHTVFASAESVDAHYRIGEMLVLNSTVVDNDEFKLVIVIDPQTEVSQGIIQLHEASNSAEGSNAGSYRLSLGSQPSQEITVRLEVSELHRKDVLVSDAYGDPMQYVSFSPENWEQQQAVFLTAVDDCQDERPEKFIIVHTLTAKGRDDVVHNVTVAVMDDDFLEEPTGYEMFHSRAGPLSGGTIIELVAEVQDDNAFGTNLRMGGLSIRCRFTDQYGFNNETNADITKEDIFQTEPQPGACVGSAKIKCITPEWSAAAEGE